MIDACPGTAREQRTRQGSRLTTSLEEILMDARQFDRLAMTLSTAPTRRRLLTALARGAAGTALAALVTIPGREDAAAATCRTRQQRCSSKDQCCGHNSGTVACQELVGCFNNAGEP